MHLVTGIVRIVMARLFLIFYRSLRWRWIGRRIIRMSCSAFVAGAGLDDAAMDLIREMDDGLQLLREEADRKGEGSVPAMILSIMQSVA